MVTLAKYTWMQYFGVSIITEITEYHCREIMRLLLLRGHSLTLVPL